MNKFVDETEMFHAILFNNLQDLTAIVRAAESPLPQDLSEQVLQTLDYALLSPDRWSITRNLMLAVSPKMRQSGYQYSWTDYLTRAIAQSQADNDSTAAAELLYQLGLLHQLHAKNNDAKESLNQSAELYKNLGQNKKYAATINRLAFIARRQHQFSTARELVQQAMSLLEEHNLELEYSHFVLGSVALDEGDSVAAEHRYRQSLAICQSHNVKHLIAQRLGHIGLALFHQQKYPEALSYFERSIPQLNEAGDPVHAAIMRINASAAHIELGEPDKALILLAQAEPTLQDAYDRRNLANRVMNEGIAYRMLQRWAEAEEALQSAIERWIALENTEALINARAELAITYMDQGKNREALAELETAQQLLPLLKDTPAHLALTEEISAHLSNVQKAVTN